MLAARGPIELRLGSLEARMRRTPSEVIAELDRLVIDAVHGRARARESLHACALWMIRHRDSLGELAAAAVDHPAAVLFRDGPPGLAPRLRSHEHEERDDWIWQMTPVPRTLASPIRERLLLQHWALFSLEEAGGRLQPTLMRRLLRARGVMLQDVIRLAARRPSTAAIVREIAECVEWSRWPIVCKTLALNPYSPPEIACKLLPILARADLRAIAAPSPIAIATREAAGTLLELAAL